jgi:transcriptional regulator with XRE-family HTH domain
MSHFSPSDDIRAEWARYYVHAPGASVVVYSDGNIDSQRIQDKPVLGIYRLARFEDDESRERLTWDWERNGLTADQAKAIMTQIQALPAPGPDVLQRLDNAATQYGEILYAAQKRILELCIGTDPLPKLWLDDAAAAALLVQPMLQNSLITVSPSDQGAALQAILNDRYERLQHDQERDVELEQEEPEPEPTGHRRIKAEDRAFPLPRGDDANRGTSRQTAPKAKRRGPYKNNKAQLDHFRRQSLGDKQWWIRDHLESIRWEKTEPEFGDLMRWLRVNNGHATRDIADAMGLSKSGISLVENLHFQYGTIAVPKYASYVLGKDNPFLLPTDGSGEIEPWVRKVIEHARDRWLQHRIDQYRYGKLNPLRRDAALEQMEQKITDYRQGRLSIRELPTLSDMLDLILPQDRRSLKDMDKIAMRICKGDDDESKARRQVFKSRLKKRSNITSREIVKLAEYAKCDERYVPMLLRLPRGSAHQFDERYRDEMTEPEFQRVFAHPGHYKHAGQWLKALREARQMTQEEVGEIMDIERQTVNYYESNKYNNIRGRVMGSYLRLNPLHFFIDPATGQVTADVAATFRLVMGGGKEMKDYEAWPTFGQAFRELGIGPGHDEATRRQVSDLVGEIQAQTRMEDGEGITTFSLDGRSYTVRRTFNGELRFAPETIEALRSCPTIKQIIQEQKSRAGQDPSPSRG